MTSRTLFCSPITISSGGALTSTNVGTTADPAAYDVAHTYALGDQATSGDNIYQSAQTANTGNAVTDTAWWTLVGSINKLRMFDRKIGSQTENADTIEVVVTPNAVVTLVSVRNLSALSVQVQQSTPGEGLLFDQTIELDEPVTDWFAYFYSDVVSKTDVIFTGLAPYVDSVVTVTINNTGGTAKCGELLMGAALDAGITESGVQDGIDDYSLIQADSFGVRDIVQRDFVDNMELTLYVESAVSSTLRNFLTQNRAKPILVVAAASRPDAQVFGLAESWRRILSYPGLDVFNVSMKGLT